MTEGLLQDEIRLALGAVPGLCLWRNNIGTAERHGHMIRYGVGGPGGADLIGLYRGRFVALEIKTERGKLSPEQKRFGDLITGLGGAFAVVRSVEEAIAWTQTL